MGPRWSFLSQKVLKSRPFKDTVKEDFDLQFFFHSNLPGPLTNGLKYFRYFREDILCEKSAPLPNPKIEIRPREARLQKRTPTVGVKELNDVNDTSEQCGGSRTF